MSTKAHLNERPLFSARYGVLSVDTCGNTRGLWTYPWGFRHGMAVDFLGSDPRCDCPGTNKRPCLQAMTQEDLLCDECRQWCVAVDNAGNYHQLASVL